MATVRADTYELNFAGNLEAKVASARTATAALEGQFGEAKAALKTLQDAANEELFAKSPIAKARADVRALGAEFRTAGAQAKAAERDFSAAAKAAERQEKVAARQAAADQKATNRKAVAAYQYQREDAEEKAAKSAAFYQQAGEYLTMGAAAVVASGIALAASGLAFAVSASQDKAGKVRVLDRLTAGQGELAYKVTLDLAGETGVDPQVAATRVKKLIAAKFGADDTKLLFKAAADLDVVTEGGADKFLGALEAMEHRGKATERDLRAMTKAGIDLSRVFAELGQKGETLEGFEARLKHGKIEATDFARAAAKAAEADYSGLSGKGFGAQINKAKIAVTELFTGLDTSGLTALGERFNEALSGASGEELKASISAAGGAVLELTKNITAADIKGFLTDAAGAAKEVASGIIAAAKGAAEIYQMAQIGITGHGHEMQAGGADDQIEHEIAQANLREQLRADERAHRAKERAETAKAAHETGVAYGEGFAKGIDASAAKPAAAAAAAGKGVVAAGNAAIKAHSPSREAEQSGGWYDEGWERGIAGGADKPAAAARAMGGGIVKAGVVGVGGPVASSGGAAGGDVQIQFSPSFHFAASTPDDVRAELKRAIDEMTPAMIARLLAGLRQNSRDAREGPRT